MNGGQLTKETIELIAALRPFTGHRGQKLIDTLIELSRPDVNMGAMDVHSLTARASDLLSERLDSAVSLSLILAAAWLGAAIQSNEDEADETAQPARGTAP